MPLRRDGVGGQGAQGGHGRCQLAGVGQVHAADLRAAGDSQDAVLQGDSGAELGQDFTPFVTHLGGVGGPVGDAHGAPGGQGGGQERAGVGEVLLQHHVKGGDGAGRNDPVLRGGIIHHNAHGAQDFHRHGDVVNAGHGITRVLQVQALGEARAPPAAWRR